MTPHQLCLKAAEVIEERGLCKGVFSDEHWAVCAMKAVLIACDDDLSIAQDVCAFFRKAANVPDIPHWNDAHTKAEVVAKLLREVAAS